MSRTNPKLDPSYPVYIISKGRWKNPLTASALLKMEVPFSLVVEPQEFDQYAEVVNPSKILVLPFSDLGQGSIPARNWVWNHAVETGASHHWILDDNIRGFYRMNRNKKVRVSTGITFRLVEDFVNRYENVAMSGMNYEKLYPRREKRPPLVLNTRIYSCVLLRNDLVYRWRGRYNEDTDLSLRILKGGWCTMLFNAFLAEKVTTMVMKGGNTDTLYQNEGRLRMAQSLALQHPDVVKIVWKWNRWQHQVDYRPFKKNKLILKKGVQIPPGTNEHGMILTRKELSN